MLLKDRMGLKMENFNIMWVQLKTQFLGGEGGWGGEVVITKKIYMGWNCLKQGGLDSLQI